MNKKRQKILNLTLTDAETMAAVVDGHGEGDLDHKAMRLTVGVGQLAALLNDPGWTRSHLRKIYGFTTGWLVSLGSKRTGLDAVAVRISTERDRQQELVIAGKLPFNCSFYRVKPTRKLRVLTEELGEVAKAIDQLEIATSRESLAIKKWREELVIELTQVAAVAVAWLEALEGPSRNQPGMTTGKGASA